MGILCNICITPRNIYSFIHIPFQFSTIYFVFRLAESRVGVPFPMVVELTIMLAFFSSIKRSRYQASSAYRFHFKYSRSIDIRRCFCPIRIIVSYYSICCSLNIYIISLITKNIYSNIFVEHSNCYIFRFF